MNQETQGDSNQSSLQVLQELTKWNDIVKSNPNVFEKQSEFFQFVRVAQSFEIGIINNTGPTDGNISNFLKQVAYCFVMRAYSRDFETAPKKTR